jgi:hypothetical protein
MRFDSDSSLRWFLAVAAVGFLVVFVVRADELDPEWVALLGSMMGLGVLRLGGDKRPQ